MIRGVVHELVGLFVDDGLLALGLVVWTVIVAGLRSFLPDSATPLALILAAGYLLILLASVTRAARR